MTAYKKKMSGVKLYPQIEEDKAMPVDNFRLAHVTEEIKFLERELTLYSKCRRRYSFAYNALFFVNTASTVVSSSCAVTSLGLFTSGMGSLFAIPLLGVGLGSGVISAGVGIASKKVLLKVQKHESITALVSAKLSSLKMIVSKALEDKQISDEEFKRVQDDIENYKMLKRQIQNKTLEGQVLNMEKVKHDFLEEGRKLGIQETLAKLTESMKVSTKRSPVV